MDPSRADVQSWIDEPDGSNVALRAPGGVLCVDVDCYDGKAGAATIEKREALWGPLSPTWVITSRDDGSGIRLFRAPAGLAWRSGLPGVELIHHGHRYLMAPPSVHPEGGVYRLIGPDGQPTDRMPRPEELPPLPDLWIENLSKGKREHVERAGLTRNQASQALIDLPWAGEEPCHRLVELAEEVIRAIRSAGTGGPSRHDTMRDRVLDLVRVAERDRHAGLIKALASVRESFVLLVSADKSRTVAEADAEWQRALDGAVKLVVANPMSLPHLTGDRCLCSRRNGSAAELSAAGQEVDPDEEFWTAREELTLIRDWARSRIVAPWAVLGAVFVRLLTLVPPNVKLPPTVGVAASLNTFVGLVGPSGRGKDIAVGVAEEVVLFRGQDPIYVVTPGSGQGIAHQFRQRVQVTENGTKVWKNDTIRSAVLFEVSEVDTLTAMAKVSGSTLSAEMRKVWSGLRLGSAYVDQAKAVVVPAHQYRACMLIGIQPGRAAPLLDEADGGTPQRILWFPATDPFAPDVDLPDPPKRVSLDLDAGMPKITKPLAIPPDVAREIRSAQRDILRGEDRSLEASLIGHLRLSRLKVAVALAILNGRLVPITDDWVLAGMVIKKSESTRREVMAELHRSAEAEAERRGDLIAVQMDATDARRARSQDQREQRVRRWLLTKWLPKHPGATRAEIREAANSADRRIVLPILDQLVDDGLIAEIDGLYKII